VGDLEWNRGLAKTAIRELGIRESGITVLPELMSSGYVFDSPDEARSCAEPADGPTVSEWTADAATYGIVIVGGFAELGEDGRMKTIVVFADPGPPTSTFETTA